jgi:RNA-directed DNA polymerase
MVKKGMPSEFGTSKEYVEFLGYKLSVNKISIKDDSVRKIKKQVSYILYKNLIKPVKAYQLKSIIIPNNNEDPAFVTAMMQIRRYLYGNLSEEKLNGFLNGKYKRVRFKGIMSFYPLIDDEEQLRSLDGWLVSTILNSLKLREQLFLSKGYISVSNNFPFNTDSNNILLKCRTAVYKGRIGLYSIPSFLRIYNAIKKGVLINGIEYTMNKSSNHYDY